MTPLPRRSVSAGARPCPGRSSSGLTALQGDPPGQRLRSGSYMAAKGSGTTARSAQSECPRFQGNPVDRIFPSQSRLDACLPTAACLVASWGRSGRMRADGLRCLGWRWLALGDGGGQLVVLEGLLDAPGFGGSDALIDRQCLPQLRGAFAAVAILEVAAADALQGARFFLRDAKVPGDGQGLGVVVAGLLGV